MVRDTKERIFAAALEGLEEMTIQMVDFTVHDEMVVMTRIFLTIEQFRD